MKKMRVIGNLFSKLFAPIKANGTFFIFMYLLGLICTYVTVPNVRGAHAYSLAPLELFFDLYLICLVLMLFPKKIRKWVRRLFYIIAYSVAIADVFCFVKYDSTITPTMLLLLGETNSREAGEFLSTCFSPDILFSNFGFVILLLVIQIAYSILHKRWKENPIQAFWKKYEGKITPILGLLTLILFVWGAIACWNNKKATYRLMSYHNIGEVEHELTRKDKAVLYQPLYRLAFSIYANRLTSLQLDRLIAGIDDVKVDSCSYRSQNIVLIIGESYNKSHSQLYGYNRETTPRQMARAKKGELIPFTDVVAPWNLTSFAFKLLFSLYTVGDKNEWCDYPLFPELFRKAGYSVSFITNQFLPQAKEAVYDFSGGFFLNNPTLSKAMFDKRNSKLYYFDEGLLSDWDKIAADSTKSSENNLVIFHLKGQHVDYRTRCPKSKQHWTDSDYDRPKLNRRERRILSYYDNSLLYNDSIVDQIIKRYEDENAIVIYLSDHGEQVFDEDAHVFCRVHSQKIDAHLAKYEYEIPFWIYCSHEYMVKNPEIYNEVILAKNRKYMTDALPHLLLYLADIHTKDYREELNILSSSYNENRPRILKNTTDYDKVIHEKKDNE